MGSSCATANTLMHDLVTNKVVMLMQQISSCKWHSLFECANNIRGKGMHGEWCTWTTLRTEFSCCIWAMKVVCTWSNSTDSLGNCLRMSSDPTKMFSRYIQLLCTYPAHGSNVNQCTPSLQTCRMKTDHMYMYMMVMTMCAEMLHPCLALLLLLSLSNQ